MKSNPISVRWALNNDAPRILDFQIKTHSYTKSVLALDRSPDLMRSYATEGKDTRVLLAERSDSQEITGCAALSFKNLYFNANPTPIKVGYLGSLLTTDFGARSLDEGFRLISKMPKEEQPHLYLTTIFKSNQRALKVLGSRKLHVPANYQRLGSYKTFLIKAVVLRKLKPPFSHRLTANHLTDFDSDSLNAFIQNTVTKWQGFPQFELYPGLTHNDFVSVNDKTHTRGLAALWDSRSLKRWRVVSKGNVTHTQSWIYSIYSKFRTLPSMMSLSDKLIYISLCLTDPQDDEAYVFLLQSLAERAIKRYGKEVCLCFGMHESNPLLSHLLSIPSLNLESEVFQVLLGNPQFQFNKNPWYIDAGGL